MDKTLVEKLAIMQTQIDSLSQEIYRNNFSSHQDFNKFSNFNTRLKVPHYDQLPPIGEVGEIIESQGKLYICSANNSFSLVGGQT